MFKSILGRETNGKKPLIMAPPVTKGPFITRTGQHKYNTGRFYINPNGTSYYIMVNFPNVPLPPKFFEKIGRYLNKKINIGQFSKNEINIVPKLFSGITLAELKKNNIQIINKNNLANLQKFERIPNKPIVNRKKRQRSSILNIESTSASPQTSTIKSRGSNQTSKGNGWKRFKKIRKP